MSRGEQSYLNIKQKFTDQSGVLARHSHKNQKLNEPSATKDSYCDEKFSIVYIPKNVTSLVQLMHLKINLKKTLITSYKEALFLVALVCPFVFWIMLQPQSQNYCMGQIKTSRLPPVNFNKKLCVIPCY